jgi:aromatic-L-amino-acid decarboxylase
LAFQVGPPGAPAAARDEATRRLLERINARGRFMLTGCTVDGRLLAWVCVLSFRTRRRHAEVAVEQIVEEAAGLLAEGAG